MSFADKTLTCRDCGDAFTFTSGEQEFYAQKGFDNEPTRCPTCRQNRKQSRNNDRYSRDDYGRDSYGGGYDNDRYGRDSYGGASQRAPREMHAATCAGCGQTAEVPFVPRGDKPVYCRSCFQGQRASAPRTSARW